MCASAQVRSRADAGDAHVAHVPLHRLAVDTPPFSSQLGRDAARAVKGILRVERIDAMLERHLLRRGLARLVVETRSADAQQVRLRAQRNGDVLTLNERHAFLPREGRGQCAF
jgi:hypothetical protein